MAILRDYKCNACFFEFESMLTVPTCTKCGTTNVKKLLSAPAGKGNCAHGMLYPSRDRSPGR